MSQVYINKKHFLPANELEEVSVKEWQSVTDYVLNHLVSSMKNRVPQIIRKSLRPISYYF